MIVIVSVENNRVAKFKEFDDNPDGVAAANTHIAEHGGFLYEGSYSPELWVVGEDVSTEPIVETPEEKETRIKAEIDAIERREIMPRKTREIQIQVMEYFAGVQGLTPSQLYAVNPAYKGMVDVNNQIIALRAQI